MNEFILPDTSMYHKKSDGTRLHVNNFADGTCSTEVSLSDANRYLVVTIDGEVVPKPGDDRYPFTNQLAKIAIEHFNEHDSLPDWVSPKLQN